MQTTAQTTSAGGTGMNTAQLAGGLPSGFDPAIWSHHSYPFLVNIVPNDQNTTPGPPVIPPVGETTTENLQPPDQQINANTPGGAPSTTSDPVPNALQFRAAANSAAGTTAAAARSRRKRPDNDRQRAARAAADPARRR
jgi:hypothetical protein